MSKSSSLDARGCLLIFRKMRTKTKRRQDVILKFKNAGGRPVPRFGVDRGRLVWTGVQRSQKVQQTGVSAYETTPRAHVF